MGQLVAIEQVASATWTGRRCAALLHGRDRLQLHPPCRFKAHARPCNGPTVAGTSWIDVFRD